jgi:site-specific recombinase XerC
MSRFSKSSAAISINLDKERGQAPKSIIAHLPVVRPFLREVCSAGASDLGRIGQEDIIRYVERHARDRSADSGKVMCWALRAFLRYLHCKGLNRLVLAGCVRSVRRWKLANLPTYLSAAQVQEVLDSCDRATALGRRDYAILMILAKLGMRGGDVATLDLDDIDWRSGEMLICGRSGCAEPAGGPQRCRSMSAWTPDSVLCHLESGGRRQALNPSNVYERERHYFIQRWGCAFQAIGGISSETMPTFIRPYLYFPTGRH